MQSSQNVISLTGRIHISKVANECRNDIRRNKMLSDPSLNARAFRIFKDYWKLL